MDLNDFRSWFTLVMIIMFVLIVAWAWSHKRAKDFQEAANLPLNEPEHPRPLPNNNKGGDQ
jgi:cytochrome c oxidase cbb3-type subunit 4